MEENSQKDKKKHAIKDLQGVFTIPQSEAVIHYVDSSVEHLAKESDIAALRSLIGDILQLQLRSEQRFVRIEGVLEELAEAQKRTEDRLDRLEIAVEKLAEAQRRTEERVEELAQAQKRTDERIEELAQAQKRTEERVDRLEIAVEKLAEAQRRTEERVEELAQALKRLEERVDRLEIAVEKLAEAQRRTEERVEELAQAQKRTEIALHDLRVAVGSLAHTFGFNFEEFVADLLPPYLDYYYQIKVAKMEKFFIEMDQSATEEIDLLGEGIYRGDTYHVAVECQVTIGGGGVKDLVDKFARVEKAFKGKIIKIIVALNVHPSSYPIAKSYKILLIPYSRLMRGEKNELSFYDFI